MNHSNVRVKGLNAGACSINTPLLGLEEQDGAVSEVEVDEVLGLWLLRQMVVDGSTLLQETYRG